MSRGCLHTRLSQHFRLFCVWFRPLFQAFFFTENKQPHVGPFARLIILKPGDAGGSCFSLPSLSMCRFLLRCLCISISTRLLFSAFHSLAPSLHGRVVINPYFIAGEFLSLCRTDSSPRSKTRLGPNPILPPSISPSLPPSGPDYRDSGGVGGGCWRKGSHHYTLGEGRRNGRMHNMLTWRTEEEEEEENSPIGDENRRVCRIDRVYLEQQKTIPKLGCMKLLPGVIKYI